MEKRPNVQLGEVMQSAGCSNTSLALRVQAVAKEHGANVNCTHVAVRPPAPENSTVTLDPGETGLLTLLLPRARAGGGARRAGPWPNGRPSSW